jgi:polyhydroxyalkanoate synthesis repressor PhaR
MLTTRTIKKYPNRRLYDTELSHYVTLVDVRDLVMQGVDFAVIDTSNSEDITRSILLQIMLEEETGGTPLFSAKMLAQLIRFYGGTFHGLFARYLEESLDQFAKQDLHPALGDGAFDSITRMAQSNIKIWAEMQQGFLRAAGLGSAAPKPEEEKKS